MKSLCRTNIWNIFQSMFTSLHSTHVIAMILADNTSWLLEKILGFWLETDVYRPWKNLGYASDVSMWRVHGVHLLAIG